MGRFRELNTSAWWTPKRVGDPNAAVSYHQQLVFDGTNPAHTRPQTIAVEPKYLFSRLIQFLFDG